MQDDDVKFKDLHAAIEQLLLKDIDLLILPLRMESEYQNPSLLERLQIAEYAAIQQLTIESAQATVHPHYPNLHFLTAPMNRPVEKIDISAFAGFIHEARRSFDYIFLDAPAGVDAGFRLVCAAAARFLVVTGPGPAAVRDAARVGELLELKGKKDARLVVNRVDKNMLSILKMTIDDVMDTAGLPLIGIVMEDSDVTLAAACGLPLLRFNKRSAAVKSYTKIANRIQGIPEPISFR